jgi:hypothetical protein
VLGTARTTSSSSHSRGEAATLVEPGLLPGLEALQAYDDLTQARRLALEDLELARRAGAPWVIGRGLRILASVGEGPDRLDLAREAVARLEETSARLELAKARAALAGALADEDDRAGARDAWARAAELARECGARGLAERAAQALDEARAAR